jgi:NAD+ synthase (glutamine-hydrolysing)
MKVGVAQINSIVGDLTGNRQKILHAYQQLAKQGADIVVFPELTICGYPPRDLILRKHFVKECEDILNEIASKTKDTVAIIGSPMLNPHQRGNRAYNGVAWCHNGKIEARGMKCLLPNYSVFEEKRVFESGTRGFYHQFKGKRIGVLICEDMWVHEGIDSSLLHHENPLHHLVNENLDLLINISASPWDYLKKGQRDYILKETVRNTGCPLVYCNYVAANDELIFDGHSSYVSADGEKIETMSGFTEELKVWNVALNSHNHTPKILNTHYKPHTAPIAEIANALAFGIRDYAHKNNIKKTIIGLSGGIDSSVVACLAVNALGKENVIGVSLPHIYTSQSSKTDAEVLAKNLGIKFHTASIETSVKSVEDALQPIFGTDNVNHTSENIQARMRGMYLMGLSNKWNALLLNTGNKSEYAMGFCSLYGDMAGGLAVLGDLYKYQIYELGRHLNNPKLLIPESVFTKAPSAELRPNQTDQDTLPPYDLLDAILKLYIEDYLSIDEIVAKGFERTMVEHIANVVRIMEYKRKQATIILKVSPLAFGIGRRVPIVQGYRG